MYFYLRTKFEDKRQIGIESITALSAANDATCRHKLDLHTLLAIVQIESSVNGASFKLFCMALTRWNNAADGVPVFLLFGLWCRSYSGIGLGKYDFNIIVFLNHETHNIILFE